MKRILTTLCSFLFLWKVDMPNAAAMLISNGRSLNNAFARVDY